MFCKNCGANCPDTSAFCPGCGAPQTTSQYDAAPYSAAPVSPAPSDGFAGLFHKSTTSVIFMVGCIVASVYFLFNLISSFIAISDVSDISEMFEMVAKYSEDFVSPVSMLVSIMTLLVSLAIAGTLGTAIWMLFIKNKSSYSLTEPKIPMLLIQISTYIGMGYAGLTILMSLISGFGAYEEGAIFAHVFSYFGSSLTIMDADSDTVQVMLVIGSLIAGGLFAMYYLSLMKILFAIPKAFKTGKFNVGGNWVLLFAIFTFVISGLSIFGNLFKLCEASSFQEFYSTGGLVMNFLASLCEAGFKVLFVLGLMKLEKDSKYLG